MFRKTLWQARIQLATVLGVFVLLSACSRRSGPPYSPEEALKTISIEPGFRVELFATEPMVTSPVAMEFDENGRIFVVEMPGYPLDTRPTGRVKLLEDTNGDGRPDRSTVFADGLVLPTGVMRWKRGILVTAAPDVWYFEDSDGDGRAEVRRKVLTGFPFTNPQHTVNTPVYGLDNWIYLANEGPAEAIVFKEKFGDQGSDIRYPDRNDVPALKAHDRGVRFRPDTHQLESLSGGSQFGHTFDEWGHYFTLDSENNGRHEVIAARYLQRNPDLLIPTAMQDMSDHESAAKVFPITRRPEFQLLTNIGTLTSACSLTLYLGGAFRPNYRHVSFLAEPAHNLVHADRWAEAGSTFVMQRLRENAEFLASTDSWFRPANLYIGPDGALYLVDYYRRLIEHPEWTSSQHHHDSKELYEGSDKGRIYRIVPDSPTPLPLAKNIRLGDAPAQEWVRHLDHPNVWWRRTSQRLLVDRPSAQVVETLVRLFRESPSALARLHALWTLEGVGKLDGALVEKALEDSEPGVRENAIRLAESHLTASPGLAEKLLRMAGDPSPKVRFQLLCTLGFVDSPQARAVQEKLLLGDIEDEWMQVAALSASSARAPHLFDITVSAGKGITAKESKGRSTFFRLVCAVVGSRQNPEEIQRVLAVVAREPQVGSEWWRAASLEGLAYGAGKRMNSAALRGSQEALLKLFDSPSTLVRRASLELLKAAGLSPGPSANKALKRAAAMAADRTTAPELRADCISLLALAGPDSQTPLFERLIDPQEPEAVQTAAVRALGEAKGNEVGKFLLAKWRTLTAPVRSEAADALEREPGRTRLLLDAIRNEEVQSWALNFSQKRALIMNEDSEIRNAAHALLEEKPGEREKVLKRYEVALDMNGDAARGEQVFKRVCSKCHKKNGVGTEVGPDLGTVQNRPAPILLSDILMPSKSIAPKYEAYVVETVSGGVNEGVMGSQSPTAIILRREEGKEIIVPRKDVRRMYVANLSAMPADLDKQVDVQQMADLLKFLTTSR
jgi:putative membrane-bound dehydrogenase-like protein